MYHVAHIYGQESESGIPQLDTAAKAGADVPTASARAVQVISVVSVFTHAPRFEAYAVYAGQNDCVCRHCKVS